MNKCILIVDDTQDIRKVVRYVLEKDGCVVLEASDGAEAIASVKNIVPSLILLDLHLPDIEGKELFKQFRHNEKLAKVPICFLTASDDAMVKELVATHGADGYLTKPFNVDALRAMIKKMVK